MIEYVKGDLFAEHHPFIAHGCNAQGVMGSGIAKIIREKWPECYKSYKKYCESNSADSMLGTVYVYTWNTTIFNCITQLNYGKDGKKYVSYDAIDKCFENIGSNPFLFVKYYLAMPKIGAGLGGGNWEVIEAIIKHRLKDIKVKVYEL